MRPGEPRRGEPSPPLTEAVAEGLGDLDLRPTAEVVGTLISHGAAALEAVEAAAVPLTALVEAAAPRLSAGGRLVYAGAGSSGLIAALDASELSATFGFDERRIAVLLAGEDLPPGPSRAAAEDDADAGRRAAETLSLTAGDCVVAVSASGTTPYTVAVAEAAGSQGALTAALACERGSPLAGCVEHPVELIVGPEAIAGSTRLESGTAQKLALNAFSTATMVRIGRTYGNLMAGMRPANAKLRRRAVAVCVSAAGCSQQDALASLEAADWDVAVALVALLASVGADEARARLEAGGGNIRRAAAPR